MAAATSYRRLSAPNPASFPLRTLAFDDQDYSFFTYTGTWYRFNGTGWPGGASGNAVSYRAAVVPSEPLPVLETAVVRFRGTPEEGLDFRGATEDGGQLLLFIRALDSPTDSGWVQFGPPIGSLSYRYQWRPEAPRTSPQDVANYANTYLGQSYYSSLASPGIVQVWGLPAGRYQFQLRKVANTTDPNDNGNKATYFDGAVLQTRA